MTAGSTQNNKIVQSHEYTAEAGTNTWLVIANSQAPSIHKLVHFDGAYKDALEHYAHDMGGYAWIEIPRARGITFTHEGDALIHENRNPQSPVLAHYCAVPAPPAHLLKDKDMWPWDRYMNPWNYDDEEIEKEEEEEPRDDWDADYVALDPLPRDYFAPYDPIDEAESHAAFLNAILKDEGYLAILEQDLKDAIELEEDSLRKNNPDEIEERDICETYPDDGWHKGLNWPADEPGYQYAWDEAQSYRLRWHYMEYGSLNIHREEQRLRTGAPFAAVIDPVETCVYDDEDPTDGFDSPRLPIPERNSPTRIVQISTPGF